MAKRSLWKANVWLFLFLLLGGLMYSVWPATTNLEYLAERGAKYDVHILRDTWGVPHIFGKSDADAAFGLAYAHTEDDFLTNTHFAVAAIQSRA